jgi:hypothetical protein
VAVQFFTVSPVTAQKVGCGKIRFYADMVHDA